MNSNGRLRNLLGGLSLVVGVSLLAAGLSSAAEAPPGLGTAGSYAVLAGAGVTNTGPTVLNGDVGTCPTPAITGFPPGTVNGTVHAADAECLQAQSDLTIAYDDAAGRSPTVTYPGVKDLGGETLTGGVYRADAFEITGTLTLDAEDDPDAVFIFQAGSTLTTAPNSNVALLNGAQACNVFWQVGSSATLGVGSTFMGTILALTSITANTNAVVAGRLLARNGAVTLDTNIVTVPTCLPPTTTTVPGATTTTVPGATTTVPGATTTVPGATTTTAPGATTTTAPGATTTTAPGATTTTAPATTTTAPGATTTSTAPTTTTTAPTATTTAPAATTSSTAPAATTTSTVSGGTSGGGSGRGTDGLARTGPVVRRTQVWAGLALALGGSLVLATRGDKHVPRRQP